MGLPDDASFKVHAIECGISSGDPITRPSQQPNSSVRPETNDATVTKAERSETASDDKSGRNSVGRPCEDCAVRCIALMFSKRRKAWVCRACHSRC
jgi:hypothetical protein